MLKIAPGRGTIDARGVPLGCAGHGNPLEVCTAQLASERRCLICQRTDGFPLPARWLGDIEMDSLPWPSVQAVETRLPSLPWAVIVLVEGRFVDPRWPIIGARSAAEAIELALARAAQLTRGARIQAVAPGHWRAGRAAVFATKAHARKLADEGFQSEGGGSPTAGVRGNSQ